MATIIDALVVTLGLNPAAFLKGSGQTNDALDKTRGNAAQTGKDLEAYGKRASDFFGKLRNEAVGLFLAFQGASSVKSFVTDLLASDAATGRLASNIGMSTKELSAWQLAVQAAGGQASDADAALSSMANALQSFKLTGSTGMDADLKGLGVTLKDLQDGPAQALLKIAEAGERMDKTQFFARASRIGLPPSVINTLEKGRSATEELIRAKERDGAASDADAEKAQKFQERLAELQSKILGAVRPALYKLVETALTFFDQVERGEIHLPKLNVVLGGLVVAALALGGPFTAAAAAILLVINNLDSLEKAYAHAAWYTHGLIGGRDLYNAMVGAGVKGTDDIDRIIDAENREKRKRALGGDGEPSDGGRAPVDPDFARRMGAPSDAEIAGAVGGGGGNMSHVEAYLRGAGYSAEQARGIASIIQAESGGRTGAFNGAGGGQGAYGIAQWRGPRLRALRARYGANPKLDEQLAFLVDEMAQRGDDRRVRSTSDAQSAADVFSRKFEGADFAGYMSDRRRSLAYLSRARAPDGGGSRSVSHTTTVGTLVVQTAATDGEGIARDLPPALKRRGLTAQAARGLD